MLLLIGNVSSMDAINLRGWLFEFYSIIEDNTQYTAVNNNVVYLINFEYLALDSTSRFMCSRIIR